MTPGVAQYHESVPRDYADNLRFRDRVLAECDADPLARQALVAVCREDFLAFCNLVLWQYNPKKPPDRGVGPITTYEFQDEACVAILEVVHQGGDLVIEKSRELGATLFCLCVALWLFLFRDWRDVMLVSRKEDEVVSRSKKTSLFAKLDFMLENLPAWLKPRGFSSDHTTKNTYTNPDNGSSIVGEATTEKAGVGGRASLLFVDEFPLIRQDQELYQGTASTAHARIFNGTHKGVGTVFYQLLYDPVAVCRKLKIHWTLHPEKWPGAYRWNPNANTVEYLDPSFDYDPNYPYVREALPTGGYAPGVRSPWYDAECKKLGNDSRKIAEEQDVDPLGASKQFFDALKIDELIRRHGRDPVWEGDVDYDPVTGKFLRLDRGEGGPLKLWVHPTPEGRLPPGLYAVGCDLSYGVGKTPSVASGGDWAGRKVLQYATNSMKPDEFAPLALALCWLCATAEGEGAILNWEKQGPGAIFGPKVIELGYRNLYWRFDPETIRRKQDTNTPGFHTDDRTKLQLFDAYRGALYAGDCVVHSAESLEETKRFEYGPRGQVKHGGEDKAADPSDRGAAHGDYASADALMWWVMRPFQRGGTPAVYRKRPEEPAAFSLAGIRKARYAEERKSSLWSAQALRR